MKAERLTPRTVHFAKADPALSMATIFRPVTKGRRPRGLDIETSFGTDIKIAFSIHTGLDTMDQTYLLTLTALAGLDYQVIDGDTEGETGRALWREINAPGNSGFRGEAAIVETTMHELIKAGGAKSSGATYDAVRKSLKRLANVSITVTTPTEEYSQRLLSYRFEFATGRLVVAMNSRICAALAGAHVRISLSERKDLSLDAAKIGHAFLCAWMRPGDTRVINLDTLTTRVWGGEAIADSTQRTRNKTLRSAIIELNNLPGWKVREVTPKRISVTRPMIADHAEIASEATSNEHALA